MAEKQLTKEELFSLSLQELQNLAVDEGINPSSYKKGSLLLVLSDKLFPIETVSEAIISSRDNDDQKSTHSEDSLPQKHVKLEGLSSDAIYQLKIAELEFRERSEQRQFELDKLRLEAQVNTNSIHSNSPHTPIFRVDLACKLLPRFTPDAIEDYLVAFERTAQLNKWPDSELCSILQSQLTGKGLKVFSELTLTEAREYNRVKRAILDAYQLTPQSYRNKFREIEKQTNESYSDFAFRQRNLFKRWLEGLNVYNDINSLKETLLIEQFSQKIPSEITIWLVDQKPKTLAKASQLADEYVAIRRPYKKYHDDEVETKQTVNSNFRQVNTSRKYTGPTNSYKTHAYENKQGTFQNKNRFTKQNVHKNSTSLNDTNLGLCFYCHKPNHISRNCPLKAQNMENKKTSVNLVSRHNKLSRDNLKIIPNTDLKTPYTVFPVDKEQDLFKEEIDPLFKPYSSKANIISPDNTKTEISVLRDSGALQSLLLENSVPKNAIHHTGEVRLIQGVGGQVTEVPLVSIDIESNLINGPILCGLISVLPPGVDFLLANDIWFKIHKITNEQYFDAVVTRSMNRNLTDAQTDSNRNTAQNHPQTNISCNKSQLNIGDEHSIDSDDSIDLLIDSLDGTTLDEFRNSSVETEHDTKQSVQHSQISLDRSNTNQNTLTNKLINKKSNNKNVSSTRILPNKDTDLTVLKINSKEELIKLQQSDSQIQKLLEQVKYEPYPNTKDYYYLDGGLLMHHSIHKKRLTPMFRIVAPKILRNKLLYLAHDIPAAGHLGKRKTIDRLIPHFFWPKMIKEIAAYCKSCDVCQHVGKGSKPSVAPLVPLPILSEPFAKITIDVVGPLPKSKGTNNRFILTVMDMATHYPEAIPLPDHKASTVAKALTTVFSRFGFPQEIQSDRGTDFMSELMQIFLSEFDIHHIKSSPLHPQSQGQIERFHRTLKNMLRALGDKFVDSWDETLPWVLFSYRECPVETLGFSPFELVHTYPVRGPLSLLNKVWSKSDSDLASHKQSVVSFLLDTRERMRVSRELANEEAISARSKSKVWYDKKARLRTFEPGQMVLAFLPRSGQPLEAKWKGPFKVLERIGLVDYIISTPTKRKTTRLCHINMLKPYFARDWNHDVVRNCLVFEPSPLTDVEHPEFGALSNTGEDKFILDHLDDTHKSELSTLLNSFSNIFSDNPGKTTLMEHHIELQPGAKPIKLPPYRANPTKMAVIRKELDDMKAMGVIEDSNSPWASPILLVPKPDNTVRFVIDYRKVNSVSIPDAFPLPRVDDLIDKIGSAKYITKIDLSKGYWQVPMSKESIPVSAFVTPFGLFQWKYMSFGLRNAPATFSKLVEKVLRGLESFTGAYLDDIIIFSDSWEEHMKHIELVFQRIKDAGLTLKRSKCAFASAVVDYLGHTIGLNSVQPRKAKVDAILSFPRPQDRKQLRQFLGIANYYRRYIPHMAQLSAVLTDLLKKGSVFIWNEATDKAFVDIKSLLASQPILRPPNFNLPFCVAVDASDRSIGAVLLQEIDGLEHPVCYYSKRLNVHQQRYSTVEKECLALVSAVRTFSVYFGTQPTTVYTDHSPIQFLQKMANYNQKLLRWSIELQQYNLIIKHRPGSKNLLPDLLSRPSHEI